MENNFVGIFFSYYFCEPYNVKKWTNGKWMETDVGGEMAEPSLQELDA